jgi:PAS domain S-box-containing protein
MYLTGPILSTKLALHLQFFLALLATPFHLQIFITRLRLSHRTFATLYYPWDAAMTSDLVLAGSYNYGLVTLSILIAMLGSYATIDLAGRVRASHGGSRLSWRIGGATAMAIGTWAMHFTGMLAFRLPVPIRYNWLTALLSFLPSLLASSVALVVVIRPKMESRRAFVASFFIGGGIAGLHYTAMASMRFQGMHRHSLALVTLSVLLAMLFALLSVWLTFLFRDGPRGWKLRKVGSVALMGAAIWVMHYTGMASASFVESATAPDLSHTVRISSLSAAGIGAVALTVLTVAVLTATLDRIQKGKVLLDELFEQAPEAVVLMNEDQSIVRVNGEFTRLFAYTPQETLGRRLSDLIVPYEFQDEYEAYADRVAHGQRVDAEGVRQRRDGSRLHVSIVQVPVSLPGGQIAKYAIYRDITERKRAEERLEATTEQLRARSASLQAAKEEEATRIAREIHDELGAAMSSLRWDLEDVDEAISRSGERSQVEELRKKIAAMMRLTDTTVNTVRRIASELRPIALDALGLSETIEMQARQFQERTGISVQCDCTLENVDLSQEQSTAAFRILQEALTNILRHAQATTVNIQIKKEDGEFILTIRDNGRGITDEEKSGQRTLGLLGMRERAHLIGGKIDITGSDGKGTVVIVRTPIAG